MKSQKDRYRRGGKKSAAAAEGSKWCRKQRKILKCAPFEHDKQMKSQRFWSSAHCIIFSLIYWFWEPKLMLPVVVVVRWCCCCCCVLLYIFFHLPFDVPFVRLSCGWHLRFNSWMVKTKLLISRLLFLVFLVCPILISHVTPSSRRSARLIAILIELSTFGELETDESTHNNKCSTDSNPKKTFAIALWLCCVLLLLFALDHFPRLFYKNVHV